MSTSAAATPPNTRGRLLMGNTVALMIAYAAPRSLLFIAAVVAARILGASDFGVYTTASAYAFVASILATMGMQPLLVREIARGPHHAPRLIGAAHLARIGTVGLMLAALAMLPALGLDTSVVAGASLLGVGYTISTFTDNLGAYFQGIERMHVWTEANTVLGIVGGFAGIVLVTATRNPVWFCAAPAVGQAAALGWLLRRAPADVRRPPLPEFAAVASLFRRLAPFAVAFVATALFYRMDLLLLARWRSPAEVGIYGAAYRFLDVTQALAIAAAGALLPHLSRNVSAGTARPLVGMVLVGTVPVAATLLLAREPLMRGLYGEEFVAGASLLVILAPVVLPLAFNMLALAILTARDAMGIGALLYVAGTVLNATLNVLWIPAYGSAGAASAAALSETALAFGFAVVLLRRRLL